MLERRPDHANVIARRPDRCGSEHHPWGAEEYEYDNGDVRRSP
jgi:hypothetical protein